MLKRLVLTVAALASPVAAQDAEFTRLVEGANAAVKPPPVGDIAAGALVTMKALAAHEKSCVPTSVAIEPPRTAAADRVISDMIRAGRVKNGWTAYGRAQGCPPAVPTRFMILRMADGTLKVPAVNKGETLANPTLMRDSSSAVAMAALLAVRKVKADCTKPEDLAIENARVISKSADLSPDWHGARFAGSWKESWTIRACGRQAEVPLSFTADGVGGAYWTVHSSEAKLLD
jgi:hypothetical protein